MEPNETSESCLEAVKEVFSEIKADIPDFAINRAPRIGKTKIVNEKSSRQMCVRFTAWRHRTWVYHTRKTKTSGNYKGHLDITKRRLGMIERANYWLREDRKTNCFVFADVNCRPCLKLEDGFHYFTNEKDLEELLQSKEDKYDYRSKDE